MEKNFSSRIWIQNQKIQNPVQFNIPLSIFAILRLFFNQFRLFFLRGSPEKLHLLHIVILWLANKTCKTWLKFEIYQHYSTFYTRTPTYIHILRLTLECHLTLMRTHKGGYLLCDHNEMLRCLSYPRFSGDVICYVAYSFSFSFCLSSPDFDWKLWIMSITRLILTIQQPNEQIMIIIVPFSITHNLFPTNLVCNLPQIHIVKSSEDATYKHTSFDEIVNSFHSINRFAI